MIEYGSPSELIQKLEQLPEKEYKLEIKESRNVDFHKKYWAFVSIIALAHGMSKEDVDSELKIKAGHYEKKYINSEMSDKIKTFIDECKNESANYDGKISFLLVKAVELIETLCTRWVYLKPKSISFAKMDEVEFREYYNNAVNCAFELYAFESDIEEHLIRF